MKKLKVIQIGLGHDHALPAANALLKRTDIEFLGIVDLPEDAHNPCYKSNSLPQVPRLSLQEALAISDLDAAVIESEDNRLTEHASLFLTRGVAVQMDKPGSQDAESFDRLFDLAKEKKLPLHTGYMYRYNPAVKEALAMAKSGELGKILYVEAEMSCSHNLQKRQWLSDYRGGMMNFLGCHLVDIILQLLGEPTAVYSFNRASGPDVGEDLGMALLEYPCGISTVKTTAVEIGGFFRRRLLIVGENGSVLVEPIERIVGKSTMQTLLKFTGKENGGWSDMPVEKSYPDFDRYDGIFDEFFAIVRGEIENPYSYEYEKLLHRTLLAACGVKKEDSEQ